MSKRNVCIGIIIFCCLNYNHVYAQQNPTPDYAPGELLVRFAPKENKKLRTESELNTLLSSINGGTINRTYKLVPGLNLVKLPAVRTVAEALQSFKNVNGILYAEPNYKMYLASTEPNDTLFSEQWGLHNTGQWGAYHSGGSWGNDYGVVDADIDAPEAWDIRTDAASDMIVAVLDTGIYYTHPDLSDNMWIFSSYSIYNDFFP